MKACWKYPRVIGKPLGDSERVLEIRWDAQITQIPARQKFLLTGCDVKSGNWAVSQKSKRQNFPTAVSKYVAISILFL
jgi:hypothetical protein